MGFLIIGIFVILFAVNWFRLRKGESVNKLYSKLDIEPVFVRKYTEAYSAVSEHISRENYIERAKGLHQEFQYDIVRYLNNEFYPHKLKTLAIQAKKKSLSFEELPDEVKLKVNERADELVVILKNLSIPSQKTSNAPRRRRR